MEDMEQYRIDIAAFQETRNEDFIFRNEKGMIVCIGADENPPKARRYRQGFYIADRFCENYKGVTRISDRISLIEFVLSKKRMIEK